MNVGSIMKVGNWAIAYVAYGLFISIDSRKCCGPNKGSVHLLQEP